METQISPELEQFVDQEVTSDRFPDREAVIAHALGLLKRYREEAVVGILAGLDDVAAGRVQPLHEAFDDLRRQHDVDGGWG